MPLPDIQDFVSFFVPEFQQLCKQYKLTQCSAAAMYTGVGRQLLQRPFDLDEDRLHRLIKGRVRVSTDEWDVFGFVSPSLLQKFRRLLEELLRKELRFPGAMGRNDALESQLVRAYPGVEFRIPSCEGEFPVHRLVAQDLLKDLDELQDRTASDTMLALSGGRSQFLVVEELKKLCLNRSSPGRLQFVATNEFKEPTGPTEYSAATLANSLATVLGGSAMHPPDAPVIRYTDALARPQFALFGAGARTGSFVSPYCIANPAFVGDLAGVPLTSQRDAINVPRLYSTFRQQLYLDQIKAWSAGDVTTVIAVIAQPTKAEIAHVILQGRPLVNRAYLSVELATKLLGLAPGFHVPV